MTYFSYDPTTGFAFHQTEAAAQAMAQECIDWARDEAGDGWEDDVDQICWGQLTERATEVRRDRPRDPDENLDRVVDFELRKVTP